MPENVLETFLKASEHTRDITNMAGVGRTMLAISENTRLTDLENFQEKPSSHKRDIDFDDLRGFVDYLNDYQTEDTICFADQNAIVAIIDGHKKDTPSWCKHKISYKYKRSHRWDLWVRNHNEWMSQEDFADFLDSGLSEIIEPTHGDVLDIVKQFRATAKFEVNSDIAGGEKLEYTKEVKGGGFKKEDIEVPDYLTVMLQPYDGLDTINQRIDTKEDKIPAYNLRVKLSFRFRNVSTDPTVQFKIQILNYEQACNETLEAVRTAIKSATGVTTYIGGNGRDI